MTDIVKRLRDIAEMMEDEGIGRGDWCDGPVVRQAAAEIDRLRALNVSLINARAAAAEVLARTAQRQPVTCCECIAAIKQMEAVK